MTKTLLKQLVECSRSHFIVLNPEDFSLSLEERKKVMRHDGSLVIDSCFTERNSVTITIRNDDDDKPHKLGFCVNVGPWNRTVVLKYVLDDKVMETSDHDLKALAIDYLRKVNERAIEQRERTIAEAKQDLGDIKVFNSKVLDCQKSVGKPSIELELFERPWPPFTRSELSSMEAMAKKFKKNQ